jgi:hypothetical protein
VVNLTDSNNVDNSFYNYFLSLVSYFDEYVMGIVLRALLIFAFDYQYTFHFNIILAK